VCLCVYIYVCMCVCACPCPQASLVKSWTTLRGREVTALGREILGGNGILTDFNVAKVGSDSTVCYDP
jgi:alkylation response protein AidB-like acyl-CoA dehydrogenase